MTSKTSIVSVVMITYAHELYIQEAIESVLMQECDFEVELIVVNDCSPDSTDAIVKKLIQTQPKGHWINYTRHETNKGMMPNFIWALQQAKGQYIALCEGDDYWTDPLKLQKQVDFMEANEDFSMCGAQADFLVVKENNKEFSGGFLKNKKQVLTTVDFLSGYPMHTSTVLLRKSMMQLPGWITDVKNGDVALFSLLSENGPAYFMNVFISVYRVTGSGVWSSASLENRYYAFKNTVNHLNSHFKGKYETQQLKWEYDEAKKVTQVYLDQKKYCKHFHFKLKNYHRYFWWFIWIPKQKQVIKNTRSRISKSWTNFRMFIGLRTRLKKLKSHFNISINDQH